MKSFWQSVGPETEQPLNEANAGEQLAIAAELLLPDYESDEELTAFTALDAEGFSPES
jgi:hypothetical protein